MSHLPLYLQTATSGQSDVRYFVGIAHDFNLSIRSYFPINETTITHRSYKFLDTVNVISNPTVVSNTPLSELLGVINYINRIQTTWQLPLKVKRYVSYKQLLRNMILTTIPSMSKQHLTKYG